MWCRVVWYNGTDVLVERAVFIFGVEDLHTYTKYWHLKFKINFTDRIFLIESLGKLYALL
jgi:adenosine/AMP kinase